MADVLRQLRRLLDSAASAGVEARIAKVVAVVATLWLAAVAFWEIGGPVLSGHTASAASMGIIAENMHRFRMLEPVWIYTEGRPDPSLVYCHHPWGIFWTTAVVFEVLGRHDFVCRLPAALLSVATPPLIFAIGRELHRPLAGAMGAVAFVVLPITLSFAAFNALEVPLMAWASLFLFAWIRARRTDAPRWYVVMVAAAAMEANTDWPGFIVVGGVLAIEALGFVATRGNLGRRRVLAWIALATAAVLIGLYYVATFGRLGKLGDLFASYQLRSLGNEAPLSAKLAARRFWIELMFTPVAIAIGKVGAVVVLARAWILKRVEELVPLVVLVMAVIQYVAFPQGADIHVFWPHCFALYFALAISAIFATISAPIERMVRGPWASAIAPGVLLLPLALVARDGVEVLVWARSTGGRFSEKGSFIQTDGDKIAVLRALSSELQPGERVQLHESMGPNWAHIWALGGRPVDAHAIAPDPSDGAFVADMRNLDEDEAIRLLFGYDTRVYGPFIVVRQGEGFQAFRLRPDEPTAGQWMFRSATEPAWAIEPDPWWAWEIGAHYGVDAPLPSEPPAGLDQLRAAHNAALERGDEAAATELRAKLLAELEPSKITFSNGFSVVGTRVRGEAQPRLTVVIEAGGPLPARALPKVRSKVVRAASWSTIMADPSRRDVAPPPAIVPTLWKRRWLYALDAALLERPGVESFEISFTGSGAPRLTSASAVLFER